MLTAQGRSSRQLHASAFTVLGKLSAGFIYCASRRPSEQPEGGAEKEMELQADKDEGYGDPLLKGYPWRRCNQGCSEVPPKEKFRDGSSPPNISGQRKSAIPRTRACITPMIFVLLEGSQLDGTNPPCWALIRPIRRPPNKAESWSSLFST